MSRSNLVNYILISLIVMMSACQLESTKTNNEITTDIIQNPVSADNTNTGVSVPQITFDKKSHDFNLILQGEVVAYTFKFSNSGKQNLILADVSSSCGCTIPTFSKKPIKPGEEGTIEVVFNSERRQGVQNKKVFVLSNAQPNRDTLEITANIVIPTEY